MNEYEQQAKDFLKKTNTTFKAEFVKHGKHFQDDKDTRDIYKATFTRGERSFFVMFGQSINASAKYRYLNYVSNDFKELKKETRNYTLTLSQVHVNKNFKEPTAYDVLACLQKYDVGTFKDFCDEFGYNSDSIKAHKTYKLVCEEYKNACMLWNEQELDLLREVQ